MSKKNAFRPRVFERTFGKLTSKYGKWQGPTSKWAIIILKEIVIASASEQ